MASTRKITYSFAGGEVTPELAGRMDLAKNQTGLLQCRNAVPLPHGVVENRAGTELVAEVGDSTKPAKLIPFIYNDAQAFAVAVQPGTFRFYTQGATLLDGGGAAVEVANTYDQAHLFALHYTQSADVTTLVHQAYAPRELRRTGAATWTWTVPTFAPTISPPGGTPGCTATGTGTVSYQYFITAVAADTLEESVESAGSAIVTNDLTITGQYNVVTWTAVTGAVRYNVYRSFNGMRCFVGTAGTNAFQDLNYTADVSRTPPNSVSPFGGADNYPAAVAYFEGRRWFAGTINKPLNVWATRSGTESNLSYSIPTRSDDRISFRAAARRGESIRHLVPMSALLMMTASAEWRVSSEGNGAITPTNVAPRPQTYVGANPVQPVLFDSNVLYAAEKGGRCRALNYDWQRQSWRSDDVSKLAPHLFAGFTIVDMALTRTPVPVLWCVRSDGVLLSLSWMPEEQVMAWARHDTDGWFESVCAIPEGNEDRLYLIVRRTIGGTDKRFVERMATRRIDDPADAWFVDCGLRYDGAPATTITGLKHLIGKTVSILADGAVQPQQVVASVGGGTDGSITLDNAASVVLVGLPYTTDLETLPLGLEVDGAAAQGRPMNVRRIDARVYKTGGLQAGPSFDRLRAYPGRVAEPYGAPPDLRTQILPLPVPASNDLDGTVCMRMADPLPLSLLALTLELEIGGG